MIGNNYNQDQSRRLVFCPRHKYGKEEVHIIHDKELVGGHLHSLFLTKLICKQRMASSNTSGGWISSQQAQVFDSLALEGIPLLEFKGKHKMISNVIHLRYLSLRFSHKSLFLLFTGGILEHLQTLDLWLSVEIY